MYSFTTSGVEGNGASVRKNAVAAAIWLPHFVLLPDHRQCDGTSLEIFRKFYVEETT